MSRAKFYFFDVGVANILLKREEIQAGSENFGRALEHLVFLELRAYLDYQRLDYALTYWRSLSQFEVDFVVGDQVAIEVKSKSRIALRDYRGLQALAEEIPLQRKIVVSTEKYSRKNEDGVEVLNVEDFFRRLWAGEIVL